MKSKLSEAEASVLALLQNKPLTCTQIGELLWVEKRAPDGGRLRISPRQSYARPAGKIIRGLEKRGLVRMAYKQYSRQPLRWELKR